MSKNIFQNPIQTLKLIVLTSIDEAKDKSLEKFLNNGKPQEEDTSEELPNVQEYFSKVFRCII